MANSVAEYLEVRWRVKGSDEAWSQPHRVGAFSEIVVTNQDRSKHYEFEARSVSNCGAKSIWVPSDYTVPAAPALPPPSVPIGSGVTDGVKIDWSDAAGLRGDLSYELQRSKSLSGPWERVAIVRGTSWVDSVDDSGVYYYRVRSVDYAGNTSDWVIIASPVQATLVTGELQQEMRDTFDQVNQDVAQAQADADAASDYAHQQAAALQGQVDVLTGQIGDIMSADEWDSGKTYPLGDLVQSGGYLYRSLVDNNTAALTDTASWEKIGQYTSLGAAVGDAVARVNLHDLDIQNNADAISVNASDLALLGAHNAGKTAFVLNQSTVKIGSQTLAQYISSVQASIGDVDARVDTEQQARIDGDKASAKAVTAVQAQLADAGNLVVKPTFSDGDKGPWNDGGQCFVVGATDATVDQQVLRIFASAYVAESAENYFPCRPGEEFDVQCWGSGYSLPSGAQVYQQIQWWNEDCSEVVGYAGADGNSFNAGAGGKTYTRATPAVAPPGAAWGRPGFTWGGTASGGAGEYALVSFITVKRRSPAEARNALAIQTMTTTVTQQGDSITALSQTVQQNTSTIEGKADASALSNYYTKAQTDGKISSSAAGLTQSFNAALADKADASALNSYKAEVADTYATSTALQSVAVASDPNPNLLPNPSGALGAEGWLARDGGHFTVNSTGIGYGPYFRLTSDAGQQGRFSNTPYVQMTTSAPVTLSFDIEGELDGRAYIFFYDSTGAYLDQSPQLNFTAAGTPVGVESYKRLSVTSPSPSGATQCAANFYQNTTATGTTYLRRIKLEASPAPTSYSENATTAQAASVTQSLTAGVNAAGKSYAQATTLVDANGRIGGTRLSSDGTVSAFDVVADRFSVTPSSGSGARMEWSNNALKVHDSSNKLRIFIGLK